MGQFSTVSRSFPRVTGRVVNGRLGQPGTVIYNGPLIDVLPDPKQTTYSYRTSSDLSDQLADLSSEAKVTRNGLSSFDPLFDKGHEFWTEKQSIELAVPNVYFTEKDSYGNIWFTRGPIVPSLYGLGSYPGIAPWTTTNSEAMGYGSRAIRATQPLRPNASAAQFVGELFEGLPSLVGASMLKERLHVIRGAGSEYLNIQFGWLPFLSDLRKMATALRRATSILSQLERDSGKVVRRRFAFPSQLTTSIPFNIPVGQYGVYKGNLGPYWGNLRSPIPTQSIARTETDVWFSGAYSYAIPTDNSLLSRMQSFSAKSNVLFGSRVTPDVVWELAPWSWLIDWKVGVGNLIANASSFSDDGLVIRYGYLMRHVRTTVQYQAQPQVTNTGSQLPASFVTVSTERKERLRATPYGFGVSTSSFTDNQWSILGALGLTRGPKSLW